MRRLRQRDPGGHGFVALRVVRRLPGQDSPKPAAPLAHLLAHPLGAPADVDGDRGSSKELRADVRMQQGNRVSGERGETVSLILDFYRGLPVHPTGFSFDEGLRLPNDYWEKCHELVQWYFPLPEKSKMHPTAPVATDADFAEFRASAELRVKLLDAVQRYSRFLGETDRWMRPKDHNHLRITRIIRCLVLAGMQDDAEFFYQMCLGMADQYVSLDTLGYWDEARKPNPAWLGQ